MFVKLKIVITFRNIVSESFSFPSNFPHRQHQIVSKTFPQLRSPQEHALESTNFDYSSAEYRVTAIILGIANYRLFRPHEKWCFSREAKAFYENQIFE